MEHTTAAKYALISDRRVYERYGELSIQQAGNVIAANGAVEAAMRQSYSHFLSGAPEGEDLE